MGLEEVEEEVEEEEWLGLSISIFGRDIRSESVEKGEKRGFPVGRLAKIKPD